MVWGEEARPPTEARGPGAVTLMPHQSGNCPATIAGSVEAIESQFERCVANQVVDLGRPFRK